MSDIKQTLELKQKALKKISNKAKVKPNGYFFPKDTLYTKREYELLDSIYSDDSVQEANNSQDKEFTDFWPNNKEELLPASPTKLSNFSKAGWFASGVAISSLIWLIYFQVNIHAIKTKTDTQVVFQQSTNIITDKNLDKKVARKLTDANLQSNNLNSSQGAMISIFDKLFGAKQVEKTDQKVESAENLPTNTDESEEKTELVIGEENPAEIKVADSNVPAQNPAAAAPKTHTIRDGDSLWIIAKDYYGDPSPSNIKKIMDANDMRRIGLLRPGKKIVIPI